MTEYEEDAFLQLSGLQHFLFCRRQWALIHIEEQWQENLRTTEGALLHTRAHQEGLTEKRGDVIITRGMQVISRRLGVSGKCDVLEFHRSGDGVSIHGWEGTWLPFPVEYKRGEPKHGEWDAAQLCGQAMCLEEMLLCRIPGGALYYGETKRRMPVAFTDALRALVTESVEQMHDLFRRGRTPVVKPSKSCNACSLKDICLPKLINAESVTAFMKRRMEESV